MQRRRPRARTALLLGLIAVFAAACSGSPSTGPDVGPTPVRTPPPAPSPTPEPTTVPAPSGPAPTPNPQQQAFGLHSPLPLSGEYAVTANMDDHSLSVVPIGAAAVATTVQLDLAPRAVGAAPNSDTVLVVGSAASAPEVAVASLNASTESGTIDLGTEPEMVAAPPPASAGGPLVVVSEADNTIRSVDPGSHGLGTPVQLGAGPHAIHISGGNAMLTPQVYVANAGDGTV